METLHSPDLERVREVLGLESRLRSMGRTVARGDFAIERAGYRFQVLVKNFLERLGVELSESLSSKVAVSLNTSQMRKDKAADEGRIGRVIDEGIGTVTIRLRVLQSNLLVCLPLELALALSSQVVSEEPRVFLQPLSSEDTTALAFLVARFLAKAPLFRMERVYLTSLDCCHGDDAGRIKEEFLKSSGAESGQTLFISCEFQGVSFPVLALLSASLLRRGCFYASLRVGREYRQLQLSECLTCWKLNLKLELKTLSSLMALKPGEFILLNTPD